MAHFFDEHIADLEAAEGAACRPLALDREGRVYSLNGGYCPD
jgi:hypothetical protein